MQRRPHRAAAQQRIRAGQRHEVQPVSVPVAPGEFRHHADATGQHHGHGAQHQGVGGVHCPLRRFIQPTASGITVGATPPISTAIRSRRPPTLPASAGTSCAAQAAAKGLP